MNVPDDFRTLRLNRYARFGLWLGEANGESCFLLVVDDLDDDDDQESNFKSVIQLSDWDGRPAMSSRVIETDWALCENARWLGEATLRLTRHFDAATPLTHVGQVYLYNGKPRLLVLDDLARLREHDLEGIVHYGGGEDGYYEWELDYQACESINHAVRVLTSAEIDSWINDWIPPTDATALSRLARS